MMSKILHYGSKKSKFPLWMSSFVCQKDFAEPARVFWELSGILFCKESMTAYLVFLRSPTMEYNSGFSCSTKTSHPKQKMCAYASQRLCILFLWSCCSFETARNFLWDTTWSLELWGLQWCFWQNKRPLRNVYKGGG